MDVLSHNSLKPVRLILLAAMLVLASLFAGGAVGDLWRHRGYDRRPRRCTAAGDSRDGHLNRYGRDPHGKKQRFG